MTPLLITHLTGQKHQDVTRQVHFMYLYSRRHGRPDIVRGGLLQVVHLRGIMISF